MDAPAGLRQEVPLAPLTTIGVGGTARFFLEASTVEEAAATVAWASSKGLPLFVLGGGSNLLIADEGWPGVVLRGALRGIRREGARGERLVVAAGEDWDALVGFAVEAGLQGLECLSGIPGSAGATPIQNVGAYGQEVAETIVEVEALSRTDGTLRRFAAADCRFAYRDSIWKHEERDRWVILGVTYALRPDAPPAVRYAELQRHLEAADEGAPSLARVREVVLALRRRKGMVLDAADPDTRSDGSFFVNPVIAEAELPPFLARASELGLATEDVPRFAAAGGVKLSAGWLIERAGFHKGYQRGRAGLSTKHALAIVNRGGASATELLALVREIREGVRARFGVMLVPEPSFVGFEGDPLGR